MKMQLNEIKVAYNKPNYINGSNYYRQRITITKDTLEFFNKEIEKRIKEGLEYDNHLEQPLIGKYSNREYSLNLSTTKFIKNLLPIDVQKRIKMDVNSYLYIKDIKEIMFK